MSTPTSILDHSAFLALFARENPARKPGERLLVPVFRRLFDDTLTPVLAYRRLVRPDARMAPSFLFESVEGGGDRGARAGRFSFMGTTPLAEVLAYGQKMEWRNHENPAQSKKWECADPLAEVPKLTAQMRPLSLGDAARGLPEFTGGWVGFAGYDTVRYLESEKLGPGPKDDRHLPDIHLQLYLDLVAFDHVQKTVLVITHAVIEDGVSASDAWNKAHARLEALVARLTTPWSSGARREELPAGHVDLSAPPPQLPTSNLGEGGYQQAVLKAKEFIGAGDIFQVVPSQRFSLSTKADPFDIYRALRVVNPSPYMVYLQIEGGMLVASSPEILCRVKDGEVTNRPLAGTRKRGATAAQDAALEAELKGDPKDRAEHIMLVDLGRNDVGRVASPGTIQTPHLLVVERYSHVMHLSSTVTGRLRPGTTSWDALRVALPVGTVSGAPKVRAMQIIDDLETVKRGPYAGAIGHADLNGNMDMAIALRTMVVLPAADGYWRVDLQAGAGIVEASDPDAEHQETVNKAAALAKAVDLAEKAFV